MRFFIKIDVKGLENINNNEVKGLVLVSNHCSNWDPFVLGLYLNRQLFFMGKSELFKIPILKNIIKKLGAFPVKRGECDFASFSYAKKIVESGKVLVMFPEGTRSKNGEILKFKKGAATIAISGGCVVLPCSIFYVKKLFRIRAFLEYGEQIDLRGLTLDDVARATDLIRSKIVEMHDFWKENSCSG